MKNKSFLMVSVLILTLALAACAAQPTATAAIAPVAPAVTEAGASTTAPVAASTDVSIASFAFSPDSLTVKVGTTVKWTNQDSMAHTVTSDSGIFDSGNLPQGQSFSYTFSTAGTYPYHCTYHANMTGTIVVTN